jgi:hypothetical protein
VSTIHDVIMLHGLDATLRYVEDGMAMPVRSPLSGSLVVVFREESIDGVVQRATVRRRISGGIEGDGAGHSG